MDNERSLYAKLRATFVSINADKPPDQNGDMKTEALSREDQGSMGFDPKLISKALNDGGIMTNVTPNYSPANQPSLGNIAAIENAIIARLTSYFALRNIAVTIGNPAYSGKEHIAEIITDNLTIFLQCSGLHPNPLNAGYGWNVTATYELICAARNLQSREAQRKGVTSLDQATMSELGVYQLIDEVLLCLSGQTLTKELATANGLEIEPIIPGAVTALSSDALISANVSAYAINFLVDYNFDILTWPIDGVKPFNRAKMTLNIGNHANSLKIDMTQSTAQ